MSSIGDVDAADLERRLAEAARSWRDDFAAAVDREYGEEEGAAAGSHLRRLASPRPTRRTTRPAPARSTWAGSRRSQGDERARAVALPADGRRRRRGAAQDLPDRGAPLALRGAADPVHDGGRGRRRAALRARRAWRGSRYIYDFGLRYPRAAARPEPASCSRTPSRRSGRAQRERRLQRAGARRRADLAAGHACCGPTRSTCARAVRRSRRTTSRTRWAATSTSPGSWSQLFEARFDPGRDGERRRADSEARLAKCAELEERISRALDDVVSLDHDRILRSYLTVIRATLRTNYFQHDDDGAPKRLHLLQARPGGDPRPARAAAALRDLRLLAAGRGRAPALRRGRPRRAALVGPSRRLPHRGAGPGQGADGEEHRDRAGRRQGRLLLQAAARPGRPGGLDGRGGRLLHDLHLRRCSTSPTTSSRGRSSPRAEVVRHDGDDPYLVVAADKGTATFSDIANGVAQDYGFWLGDAFASGGSVGYDHKAMGITARGAWVSVRRHFREMGVDCQNEDVHRRRRSATCPATCSATACSARSTSGWSPPSTTATSSSTPTRTRRRRTPSGGGSSTCPGPRGRTTTPTLISEGGGVFPRSAKSIPVSPQVREALGLSSDGAQRMTPAELMQAILLAPVDLLWNGGIGTYVKGADGDARRGRRQGQRRDPGRRRASCGSSASARAATSGSPSAAGSSTPATRRPDQHRLHRQLRRRGHLRPRGQHQDPARPGGRRRRPHREAAQRAARLDDRRGGRAGAGRQLRAEPRPGQRRRRRRRRCCTCTRTGCGPLERAGPARPGAGVRCPRRERWPSGSSARRG